MTAQQYIDLFAQRKQEINQASAPQINALRDNALKAFTELGFPSQEQEDYHHTNVEKIFQSKEFSHIKNEEINFNPYHSHICDVPNLSTLLYFVVNDSYIPTPHKHQLPEGVFIGNLKEFANTHPQQTQQHYGKIADIYNNGIIAFNTLFAQDGFVIYIPKNTIVETPIQLINLLWGTPNNPVNRRILIIAEDNAQVKILACDHAENHSQTLTTQVTEIYAGKNAMVDFYELEENTTQTCRLANTFVQQQSSSNVLINNISLQTGITRNNYRVKLDGENAEAYVCGIVIADAEQRVDNHAFLDHAKPHCQSTQLFKYILQENAVGAFCGRILVEQDAQKTMAYQTNRNLCISPSSKMYSKPQLEIYADDVKCSHGLTTGQIDENALFYLRSRGISAQEARQLLMQAFALDVLQHIRIDALQEHLIELINKRLKGEKAHCGNHCINIH